MSLQYRDKFFPKVSKFGLQEFHIKATQRRIVRQSPKVRACSKIISQSRLKVRVVKVHESRHMEWELTDGCHQWMAKVALV